MRASTLVKVGIALSFMIAIVSFGTTSVETKVMATRAGLATTVETQILKPKIISQDCTLKDKMSGEMWCNGMHPYGRTCEGPEGPIAANSIKSWPNPTVAPISGWSDRYDKGTDPAPCPWWVSGFSRVYVKFDVKHVVTSGQAEGIEYAALSWKTKRLQGKQSNACSKNLYEATGLWMQGKAPTVLLVSNLDTTAISGGYYGAVKQVTKWFANPEQNWGFVIEPSRNYTKQFWSEKCLESLEDLKLTVKYRVKQTQWPK